VGQLELSQPHSRELKQQAKFSTQLDEIISEDINPKA
jgi:hypothetical protein